MAFQVQIKNLGKLADATVRVGGLTVLAGVNNTGKSFFSKFLYSLLDAVSEMNDNPVARHIWSKTGPALSGLDALKRSSVEKRAEVSELIARVRQLEGIARAIKMDTVPIMTAHPEFAALVKESLYMFGKMRDDAERLVRERNPIFGQAEFGAIDVGLHGLPGVARESAVSVAKIGVRNAVTKNLLGNFQVPRLADLQQKPEDGISGEITGFGRFVINDVVSLRHPRTDGLPGASARRLLGESDEGSGWDPPFPVFHPYKFDEGLLSLRQHPRSVYLESPALWRLKGVLENGGFRPQLQHSGQSMRLDGVPKYFHDLVAALRVRYTGEMLFPDVFRQLTEDAIGGKVVLTEIGELRFAESGGGNYALPTTATGVVNLGILAMLIERKILDKGTFLFIDEPESNLHPAWQVEMIRALFALARGGVNVVVATHSVDIVKYLEVHAKKHPEDKALIALNHFTPGGKVSGKKELSDQLDDVLIDLTDPFHNLRLQEIRASQP